MPDRPAANYSDFIQINKETEQFFHRLALAMGLSDGSFSLLYTLCDRGEGLSPSELYADWSLSKQTGHSALMSLERRGLVALDPDPGDRRGKRVRFTPAGREFVLRHIHPFLEAERAAFARLSEDERFQLTELTRRSLFFLKEEVSRRYPGLGKL